MFTTKLSNLVNYEEILENDGVIVRLEKITNAIKRHYFAAISIDKLHSLLCGDGVISGQDVYHEIIMSPGRQRIRLDVETEDFKLLKDVYDGLFKSGKGNNLTGYVAVGLLKSIAKSASKEISAFVRKEAGEISKMKINNNVATIDIIIDGRKLTVMLLNGY